MNFERLATQLVRSMRGQRSQVAASRRLGYRSNVFANWENGRRQPTAAEFLRAAKRLGAQPDHAVRAIGATREHSGSFEVTTPDGLAAFLRHHRGSATLADLSTRTGASRYAIGRWLEAKSQPRLPDFLRLVEAMTLRVLDFISGLIDPARLPSARRAWQRLERRRRLAYELPDTEIVLLAMELDSYRALPAHVPGWLAGAVGLASLEQEERCIRALAEVGAIRWRRGKWRLHEVMAVDTSRDRDAVRATKMRWAELGLERLRRGANGLFSYNVFTVSSDELQELERLHLAYYAELRRRIARSTRSERVVVFNMQLFTLDSVEV